MDVTGDIMQSSQNSDLNEAELDALELSTDPEGTKHCTKWGVKKFNVWCEKRGLSIDMATVHPEHLAKVLRKFYVEVRTEKGGPLTVKQTWII